MDGQIDTGIEHRERQTVALGVDVPGNTGHCLAVGHVSGRRDDPALELLRLTGKFGKRSSLRAVAYTVNPSAARLSASALPMPLDAPVTHADPSAGLAVKAAHLSLQSKRPSGTVTFQTACWFNNFAACAASADDISDHLAERSGQLQRRIHDGKPMHGRSMSRIRAVIDTESSATEISPRP
jgi:hypothetical protein